MKNKGKDVEQVKDEYGFLQVELINDKGITEVVDVHMLVAKTFIPNPNNYKYVLHMDGNKENNRADNLKWVNEL